MENTCSQLLCKPRVRPSCLHGGANASFVTSLRTQGGYCAAVTLYDRFERRGCSMHSFLKASDPSAFYVTESMAMAKVNGTMVDWCVSPSMALLPRSMMLVATVGIGISGALAGGLPDLVVIGSNALGREQQLVSLMTAGAAAISLAVPRRKSPLALVTLCWCAAAALDTVVLVSSSRSLIGLVATVECIVMSVALWCSTAGIANRRKVANAAVGCASAALLLFGFVHLTRAADISSLLPAGTPPGAALPFISGSLLIACGIGIAWMRTRQIALLFAALMFVSWIPIVHIPRILSQPSSAFEWQFVSLALALSGALLSISMTGSFRKLMPIASRVRSLGTL